MLFTNSDTGFYGEDAPTEGLILRAFDPEMLIFLADLDPRFLFTAQFFCLLCSLNKATVLPCSCTQSGRYLNPTTSIIHYSYELNHIKLYKFSTHLWVNNGTCIFEAWPKWRCISLLRVDFEHSIYICFKYNIDMFDIYYPVLSLFWGVPFFPYHSPK